MQSYKTIGLPGNNEINRTENTVNAFNLSLLENHSDSANGTCYGDNMCYQEPGASWDQSLVRYASHIKSFYDPDNTSHASPNNNREALQCHYVPIRNNALTLCPKQVIMDQSHTVVKEMQPFKFVKPFIKQISNSNAR